MSESHTLIAACAFGLEAIVRRELQQLGYEARSTGPGQVEFSGDERAICRANLWLRTADRILIRIGEFPAADFDALFDGVKALQLARWIPQTGAFPVTGRSLNSNLTSVPAVQRTAKKAAVENLLKAHQTSELPETDSTYKLDIALNKDVARLTLDTTGASLHKRGYRLQSGGAPLKETLAAALVMLSFWNRERPLIDPFCGSGTIPIEAALIGQNIAPGRSRPFVSQTWPVLDDQFWVEACEEADSLVKTGLDENLWGGDIDRRALQAARDNAERAGVADLIHFQQRDFADLSSKRKHGCVITNPPYGERLSDIEPLEPLYRSIPRVLRKLPTWSHFILTSYPRFESLIQRTADRRRKLYNGRIECTYYQFHGPKANPRKAKPAQPEAHQESDMQSDLGTPPETGTRQDTHSGDVSPWGGKQKTTAPSEKGNPPSSAQTDSAPRESRPSEASPWERKHETAAPGQQDNAPSNTQPESAPRESRPSEASPWGRKHETGAPGQQDNATSNTQPDIASQPSEVRPIQPGAPASDDEPLDAQSKTKEANAAPVFGGVDDKAREQASIFRARLLKRARHLRRWPTRRKITCFRLYERDVPEVPLVVDRYEDRIHITEYERPHDRDLGRHADWLDLMAETAGETLGVARSHVFLKSRERQRGAQQHERVATEKNETIVQEGGLKFIVNLSDYIDTGLFLDHRVTRSLVRDISQGANFLNLFAYTGSFSVYAADGGARMTTTVDWNPTYLDWAKRNLRLNGFEGTEHQFVRRDSLEFLRDNRGVEPYDVAVVDPPTFSNSKRSDDDWRVQNDHAELLTLLIDQMKPQGVIYFSTNFRRFKLDESLSDRAEIREISAQTVPEDFRNRRIHRCWRIIAPSE